MSKTLVCLQETIPFYAQENAAEANFKYEDASNIKNANLKCMSGMDVKIFPQDENKYAVGQKKISRKREASNILMECVKRRDNLRNIDADFISKVPVDSINECTFNILSETIMWDNSAEKNFKIIHDKVCLNSSPKMDFSDYLTDSGIEMSSKNSSPSHSINTSRVGSEDEETSKATDFSEEKSSNGEDDESNYKDQPAIYKNLHCLHLTDESTCFSNGNTNAEVKSPVIQSLFKNVSSILYFSLQDEKVDALPSSIVQHMRWKLSTITPIIIRDMVLKIGFRLVEAETTEDWVGTWSKHLKCVLFKSIKHFQKVNHYPGSYNLGRKDKLWCNIKRLRDRHGPDAYNFFPETFVLPESLKSLKKAWDNEFEKCWIIKPPASARGTGVKVIHKWSQVPKSKPIVVQRYLSDPYLINGTKFDLRVYVLIPSVEPLRIYVFEDGLVRFASEKYSLSNQSFKNRFIHLTNYSINRKSSTYTSNEDVTSCQGHKWTLKSFWTYMSNCGIDVTKIKESITDMIIKTVISSERPMLRLARANSKSSYNCFELFGFDIMLDKNLRPWLLEVNISPSLHTRSMLDSSVKGHLVKDMFNLVGYQIPENLLDISECEEYGISSVVAMKHKTYKHKPLNAQEKKKHSHHTFEYPDEKSDILECLTPDDVRCLIESEDEYHRRGSFIRIFPSQTTSQYFVYFEHIRYYNLLLDAWEKRFHDKRSEGIHQLQNLCEKGYHLQIDLNE